MRAFAAAWPDLTVVQLSAAQLPWRPHQYLLDKLGDPSTRLWYAQQSLDQGWSRDVIAHHIDTRLRLSTQLVRAWALASGADSLADAQPVVRFYEEVRVYMAKSTPRNGGRRAGRSRRRSSACSVT